MKHFQVLGCSHDDQDVSRLEDVVTAYMVVMFPIADDPEDLDRAVSYTHLTLPTKRIV